MPNENQIVGKKVCMFFYCSLAENALINPELWCYDSDSDPPLMTYFFCIPFLVSLLRQPQVPVVNYSNPGNLDREIEVIKSRKGIYHFRLET